MRVSELPSEYVSVYHAAESLGVSISTIRRLIVDREFPNIKKAGGAWHIPLTDLSRFTERPAIFTCQDDDVGRVYFMISAGLIKIGWATNVLHRLKGLQCMSAVPVTLLGFIPEKTRVFERELHGRFAADRKHGEWFTISVDTALAVIHEHHGKVVE
jgi:excisionase family DNA binding protein